MTGRLHGSAMAAVLVVAGAIAAGAAAHPSGGDVDTGFGTGSPSAARHTCGGGGAGVFDAVRQADGEIVLVGESVADPTFANFCVVRIEEDGSLDPGFGDGEPDTAYSGDGSTEIGFGGGEGARAVALQADGRAVVAGHSDGGLAITRLDTDGTLDTTFGDEGRRVVAGVGGAVDVLVAPDGRIVLIASRSGEQASTEIVVVRLTADGAIDGSFGGGDGIAASPRFGRNDEPRAGALQADGKILVGGGTVSSASVMLAVRFNADGSLDSSFAGDGIAFVRHGIGNFAHSVAAGPGSSVTLVGSIDYRAAHPSPDFAVVRLTATGRRDRSFGPSGIREHHVSGDPVIEDAAVMEDGGLAIAGGFFGPARLRSSFFVAKTLANGMLDRNFTRRAVGFAVPPTDVGPPEASALSVVPSGGGRLVLAGQADTPFTAVQLLPPPTQTLRCRGLVDGTASADRLVGTSSTDTIRGRAGSDRLFGLAGADCISGGAGNDAISGGAGNDSLAGGTGADRLTGGSGSNAIRGEAGNDRIDSRNGRLDRVSCGAGRDRVRADAGDRLSGCEVVAR
jgi:uncharacterized delta-60 repeat protein